MRYLSRQRQPKLIQALRKLVKNPDPFQFLVTIRWCASLAKLSKQRNKKEASFFVDSPRVPKAGAAVKSIATTAGCPRFRLVRPLTYPHVFAPLTPPPPPAPCFLQSFKIFEAAPTDVRGVPQKSPAPAEYFL